MMFDWIQKAAIFAYQRRLARSTTGGRMTRAGDILDRSSNGGGTFKKVNENNREKRLESLPIVCK